MKKPRLHPILQLQDAIGNQAVLRLIQAQFDADRTPVLQSKLTVGAAHDPHEQEADRVAAEVMRVPAADAPTTSHMPVVHGESLDEGVERNISQSSGKGNPLPRLVRTFMEPRFGVDFSGVRVHTDSLAAKLNGVLNAQAFTVGKDIYFGFGKSPSDLNLTAHELTHVVQQSADIRGNPAAGALQRSPLDVESAGERDRRERLLQSISNAIDAILRLLRTGGLVEKAEQAVERGGVRGVIYGVEGTQNEAFSSYSERDARLRRIVRSLMAMGTLYRSAPIPADFSPPTFSEGEYQSTVTYPKGASSYGGKSAEWADLQAAYERYRITQGQTGDEYRSDWYYLNPASNIVPGAARGAPRIGRGIQTGAYMVFPDLDREPLRYWRLDGYSPVPKGSTIVEFLHDDFGYYYEHRGRRIDVPSPWR